MSIIERGLNIGSILLIFDIAYNHWGLNEYIFIWWKSSIGLEFRVTFVHRGRGSKGFLYLSELFDIWELLRLSWNSLDFYWRWLLHFALINLLLQVSQILVVFIGNFSFLVSILLYSNHFGLRFLIILTIVLVERFSRNEIVSLNTDAWRFSLLVNHFLPQSFWLCMLFNFLHTLGRLHGDRNLPDDQVFRKIKVFLLLLMIIGVRQLSHGDQIVESYSLFCLLDRNFVINFFQCWWKSDCVPTDRKVSFTIRLFERFEVFHFISW